MLPIKPETLMLVLISRYNIFISLVFDIHHLQSDQNGLIDAKEKQILDVLSVKAWALKMASYAANTILSVDQVRLLIYYKM